MSLSVVRDSNGKTLEHPAGLRPDFAHIARATTGASITELSLASLNVAANQTEQKQCVLRVAVIGSNPVFFSLGAASSPPGANTAMSTLPANSVTHMKASAQDVSAYHQQSGGASSLEIAACT